MWTLKIWVIFRNFSEEKYSIKCFEKWRTYLAIFDLYYIILLQKSIEIQATYALPSEAPKTKRSSTADMIPADWLDETEKGKNVMKLKGISCTMT